MQIRLQIKDRIKILFLILIVALLVLLSSDINYAADKTVYIPYGGNGSASWDSGNDIYYSSKTGASRIHVNNAGYSDIYETNEEHTYKYGTSKRRPALWLYASDARTNDARNASNKTTYLNYVGNENDTKYNASVTTAIKNKLSGYVSDIKYYVYKKDYQYQYSGWTFARQTLFKIEVTGMLKDFSLTYAGYKISSYNYGTLYVKACTSHTYGGYTTVKDSTC